jgi:hypothetical protein
MMLSMATIQSVDEIATLLVPLRGQEIAGLQVLGVNSLKTLSPPPEAVVGEVITGIDSGERTITIHTANHQIVCDLQRTGRIVRLASAEPYQLAAGTTRPTVRLLLGDGSGLDLTEPAKTKRITVSVIGRPA